MERRDLKVNLDEICIYCMVFDPLTQSINLGFERFKGVLLTRGRKWPFPYRILLGTCARNTTTRQNRDCRNPDSQN
jgi:hypothetical protein